VKAKEIKKLKKEGKKMLPGDFTVSEGHEHPLVHMDCLSCVCEMIMKCL
jgi:hypothetical protein